MADRFSRDARVMQPSPIRALAKITADEKIISLAGGHPSADSFPMDEIRSVLARFAASATPATFQYGQTAGRAELRAAIAGILKERGIEAAAGDNMLCSGSQRGLDLIGRVLLDPGDTILVEVPTYPGAVACFRNLQAEMVGIPQDEDGLRTDALQRTLERLRQDHRRPKFLYTVPNFQNPSGATLSRGRREELAEVCQREGVFIVEDDPYGELYFDEADRPKMLPIAALGKAEVIYISSFSKILAPGLRTAFIHAPADILERLELAAQASDLCSGTLDQALVLELVEGGALARSIGRIRGLYKSKAEALLTALEREMPDGVEWNKPAGGFFLWMRLPDTFNCEAMLSEAIERGVAYVPGKHFCVDGSGADALRLCFSKEPPERLDRGATLLAETIKAELAG